MDFYLASGNAHKVAEFRQLLAIDGGELAGSLRVLSAQELGGMPAVVEDAGTFVGNARKKAEALRPKVPPGAWVLSDDSGVCVDALGGAPGVESAYFAGPEANAAANLRRLIEVMQEVPEGRRQAHFLCVLCALSADREPVFFEGRCQGRLALVPGGAGGFGYDPIFVPEGETRTYSELGDEAKHRLSHRGRAWRSLLEWVRDGRRSGELA